MEGIELLELNFSNDKWSGLLISVILTRSFAGQNILF
jgi:hypothetical protein